MVALVVAAGVVVAAVLVAGASSPPPAAGAAKAPAGSAIVKRRNLVSTDTEAGTLSYAHPQTVYDRLSGTITWLPSAGTVIRRGGALFRVNGEPVILMDGSTPAYRDLSAADSDGADILELNRNLVALGFNANGITVDNVWQPGTTLGVELLQESEGETATGTLSLGRVVFLPGPQLVGTVDATLGDTANGGSSQTPADTTAGPPAPRFVSLTTTTQGTTTTPPATSTTTQTTTTPPTRPPAGSHHHRHRRHPRTPSLAALLALLKADSAQLKAEAQQLQAEAGASGGGAPSTGSGTAGGSGNGGRSGGGGSGDGSGGGSGGSGGNGAGSGGNGGGSGADNGGSGTGGAGGGSTGEAVLETTSTHLVVTVDLDASLQSEATVGERVTVQLPAGNTVKGRVTAVSSVAESSSGSDNGSGSGGGGGGGGSGNGSGSSTVPVTITVPSLHGGAGLDQAAVSVNFAQQHAKHVLSVPVTALLAVSGGNYAVQEANAPHRLIPVQVGLFAAGYVQISGSGITPGLQVTDSQG